MRKSLALPLLMGASACIAWADMSWRVQTPITDFSVRQDTLADGKAYTSLGLKKGMSAARRGNPDLPCKTLNLLVPKDMDISHVEAVVSSRVDRTLTAPVKPADCRTEAELRDAASRQAARVANTGKGEGVVQVVSDGFLDGDKHIVTLRVCPWGYEPAAAKVALLTDISLQIRFQPPARKRWMSRASRQGGDGAFQGMAQAAVENRTDLDKELAKATARPAVPLAKAAAALPYYEYVIITSADLAGAFGDFRAWKSRKGLDIGLVTVDQIRANYSGDPHSGGADDQGKIRQYLLEGWRSGKTVYALLGGDASKVPIRLVHAEDNSDYYQEAPGSPYKDGLIPTDTYYSSLNDDWDIDRDQRFGEPTTDWPDPFPEILVGRIMARTAADVANWTQTLLSYERSPGDGGNYLKTANFVQADQFQDEGEMEAITGLLRSYGFTANHLSESNPDGESPTAGSDPANAMTMLNKPGAS